MAENAYKKNFRTSRKSDVGTSGELDVFPYTSEYVWKKDAHAGRNEIQVISLTEPTELEKWKRRRFSESIAVLRSENAFRGGILKLETGDPYSLTTKAVIEEFIETRRIDKYCLMKGRRVGTLPKNVNSSPSGFLYQQDTPSFQGCTVKEFFNASSNKKYSPKDAEISQMADNFFDHTDRFTRKYVNDLELSLCVPEVAGSLDFANLDTLVDVIRCFEDAHGITTNFVYLSKSMSGFPSHYEDGSMYSINVGFYGQGKFWLAIAAEHVPEYIKLLEEIFKTIIHPKGKEERRIFKDGCNDILIHKQFVVHPRELIRRGIPFSWTIQMPGDIIITSPFSVHVGFNLGDGIHQAINFGTRDWIEYGIFSPPDLACAKKKYEVFNFDFRTAYKLFNDDKYAPFIAEDLRLVNPKMPLEGYQAAPVGPYKNFRSCIYRFTLLMAEYRKNDDELVGFNSELDVVLLELYRFTVDNSVTHRRVFDKYKDILDLMKQNPTDKILVSSGFGMFCNIALYSNYLMKTLTTQELLDLVVFAESLYLYYSTSPWVGGTPASDTSLTNFSVAWAANAGLCFMILKFFTIAKETDLLPDQMHAFRPPKTLINEILRMDERAPLQLHVSLRGLADEAAQLIQGSTMEARLLGAFNVCHYLNTSCSVLRQYTLKYLSAEKILAVVDDILAENDPYLSRFLLPVRWEISYETFLRDEEKLRELDQEMRFIKLWQPQEDITDNHKGSACEMMHVDGEKQWWDDENLKLDWDATVIPGVKRGTTIPVKQIFVALRGLPADYDHVVATFVGFGEGVVQNENPTKSKRNTRSRKNSKKTSGHRLCPYADCNQIFDRQTALTAHMEQAGHKVPPTIITVARTIGYKVYSTLEEERST